MKREQLFFLLLSFLTITCFIIIGISISEQSVLGIILALIGSVALMGFGFAKKKKFRDQGRI